MTEDHKKFVTFNRSGSQSSLQTEKHESGRPKKYRTKKTGLKFPVGKIHNKLKKEKYAENITAEASVHLCAVLEYLTSRIVNLASGSCDNNKRISSRHLLAAVRNDQEFLDFLSTIAVFQFGEIVSKLLKFPKKPSFSFQHINSDRKK